MKKNANYIRTVALRGSDVEKKYIYIIHVREKRVKQKIISTSFHPKFVSRLLLKNVKKTNFIENIGF